MAIKELRCTQCGFEFDEIVKEAPDGTITYQYDRPGEAVSCPKCDSLNLERKLSVSGFQLKGLGWTGKINKIY